MLHIDGNDDGAVVVGNSVSNDPYSGATFIVTGTMGHGLGTAFFVTQSASVVPGLHLHNARSTADTGIALRFSNHSVNAAATVGYYGEISLENTAGSPSLQNPDMVFKVQDNNTFGAQNMSEAMRIQNGGDVGIGTASPDSILHIDNGTSNTEVIIEKDAGTSGSIVFHNAGTREAHIAYSTGEDLEVTHEVSNKDIVFNFVSGSTAVEPLRLDADVGAAKVGKHFGRTPSTALSLGSGTSSTVDPTESVMIINAGSITAAANNMHTMTITDGKFSGQTVTFIFDRDFLDGSGGPSDMGAVVTGGTFLGSHVLSIIGSAMSGKSAAGASFTIVWTGSAWGVTSQNGLTSYP